MALNPRGPSLTKRHTKGEIIFDDRKLAFEGPEDFVATMMEIYAKASKPQGKLEEKQYTGTTAIVVSGGLERNLVSTKHPRGHHEMVAVLAFALAQSGTPVFTEEDMRRAYIRAGVRPPKSVGQALRDSKNKFDYLEVAGGRGHYRLTHHGDRVVRFDLPHAGSNT
jgi:hypothetical protein